MNKPDAPGEAVSLASILSEYKSEAYVRNERRLSKAELEKQAEAIIQEMKRSVDEELQAGEPAEPSAPAPLSVSDAAPDADESAPARLPEPEEVLRIWTAEQAAVRKPPALRIDAAPVTEPEEPVAGEAGEGDGGQLEAEPEPAEPAVTEPEPEKEPEAASFAPNAADTGEEAEAGEPPLSRREKRRRQAARRAVLAEEARAEKARTEAAQAEKAASQAELNPVEAARRYAYGIGSLQRRTAPAFLLCAVMALLMALNGAGVPLPALFRGDGRLALLLAGGQLAVVLLGLDVMLHGLGELLSGRPGYTALAAVANLAALLDAGLTAVGYGKAAGLPYCAAAALALAFTMLGTRLRRSAYRDIFRTMRAAKIPTVVTAEAELADEGVVLYKKLGSAKGFVNKTLEPDLVEKTYRRLSPLLLALCVALSLAAAWLSGSGAWLRCLAGISTAAATLTAALAFNRPFALISRRLAGSGAVMAGWRGAEEISGAVGLVVRDLDLFPENTVLLNGMKVLSGAPVEKVVSYTGSMILAADSGLKRVFNELMRQYGAPQYHTADFDCGTEGGVSAFIGREQVMVGSAAYMNLMGIRVPGSVDVAGAVYTAIDKELSGVFIISYTPVELVQNALFRLRRTGIRPVFAIRDFNINPAMLKSKFQIELDALPFLPAETRYQLSMDLESHNRPAALMSREGLGHYVETARSGRRLARTTRRALWMTVCGALLGMLLLFFALARGASGAASAWNLMLYMLLWAFATGMLADAADGN